MLLYHSMALICGFNARPFVDRRTIKKPSMIPPRASLLPFFSFASTSLPFSSLTRRYSLHLKEQRRTRLSESRGKTVSLASPRRLPFVLRDCCSPTLYYLLLCSVLDGPLGRYLLVWSLRVGRNSRSLGRCEFFPLSSRRVFELWID